MYGQSVDRRRVRGRLQLSDLFGRGDEGAAIEEAGLVGKDRRPWGPEVFMIVSYVDGDGGTEARLAGRADKDMPDGVVAD